MKPIQFQTTEDQVIHHTHNGIDSPKIKLPEEVENLIANLPQNAIDNPSGGLTVDSQARTAIIAILDALRAADIIET